MQKAEAAKQWIGQKKDVTQEREKNKQQVAAVVSDIRSNCDSAGYVSL